MKFLKEIIIGYLFFVIFFVMCMLFNKSLLNINITGIENVNATVKITYGTPFYTCKLDEQKDVYDIHDDLIITCTNSIFTNIKHKIKHDIFDEIYNQYSSSYGAICNLTESWNNFGVEKITAIYQKSDPDKPKYGSSYYIVVEEEDGYKAYREDYLFVHKENLQYVRIVNGMIHHDYKLIEIGEVDRHDFIEFAESQGYKLLTQNYVYGIKC